MNCLGTKWSVAMRNPALLPCTILGYLHTSEVVVHLILALARIGLWTSIDDPAIVHGNTGHLCIGTCSKPLPHLNTVSVRLALRKRGSDEMWNWVPV